MQLTYYFHNIFSCIFNEVHLILFDVLHLLVKFFVLDIAYTFNSHFPVH